MSLIYCFVLPCHTRWWHFSLCLMTLFRLQTRGDDPLVTWMIVTTGQVGYHESRNGDLNGRHNMAIRLPRVKRGYFCACPWSHSTHSALFGAVGFPLQPFSKQCLATCCSFRVLFDPMESNSISIYHVFPKTDVPESRITKHYEASPQSKLSVAAQRALKITAPWDGQMASYLLIL